MTPETAALFNNQLITKGDLVEFKNNLITEIKEILNLNTEPKKWLRAAEVRNHLNISSGTLQNYRINGTLKFTKVNGIYYYKNEDIQLLLKEVKPGKRLYKFSLK